MCVSARWLQAVDEVNKKDYALKMVRIRRSRSGQLENEEVGIFQSLIYREVDNLSLSRSQTGTKIFVLDLRKHVTSKYSPSLSLGYLEKAR